MAITRSQQARQMLKTAGAVEQDGSLNFIKDSESVTVPKEFKARKNAPATKLAYITAAEAKMLKEKKPGTPHKGPKGIPSYDSYGSFDSDDPSVDTGMSGVATSAAEAGGGSGADRRELAAERNRVRSNLGLTQLPPGVLDEETKDYRSAFIAAGGGQRVNPGFFDSRNTVSPAELARAKAFSPQSFARNRGGILGFLRSGGILGNLVRGLGQIFGLGKRFDQPTYDMSGLNTRVYEGTMDPSVNPDFYNDLGNPLLMQLAKEDDQIPIVIDNDMSLIPRKNLNDYLGITPYQKDVMEQISEEATGDDPSGLLPFYRDGGMIGGGIMDAAGRQNYFLGKLVKKATRAVKKIVKSPVGRLGLGALAMKFGAPGLFKDKILPALFAKGKLTGLGKLAIAGGLTAAPLLFQEEEEEQPTGFTGSVGGQIDPRAYTDPYGVLYGAFKAEGGSMKDEPVAKRTMPLLDMGGQEMDLRAEGGFVPIGRMEKADDVPARLSKNEFVFTADAVRNAGDGDVDKGAEVMYNMMKNLEAGGDVSEESQGLEGARNMFQTAKRLEDVV